MDLINFANKNRYSLLIIFILIIFIIIFLLSRNNISETFDFISKSSDRKEVYLVYDESHLVPNKDGVITRKKIPMYISLVPNNLCDNIKKGTNDECYHNVAVLSNEKNIYSRFEIISKYGKKNSYRLMSMANHITPSNPHLTQNLNYADKSTKLCFDDSTVDEIIYFNIENVNGDFYRIYFNKKVPDTNKYMDYYLGVCKNKESVCSNEDNSLRRLCLFESPLDAINFKIEYH